MPLDADEFDKVSMRKNNTKLGHNQTKIAGILKKNMGKAFTQSELTYESGIKYDAAVNTALHSLKIKGLITCKKIDGLQYWRGTDGLLGIDTEDKKVVDESTTDE